jgi:hypothetical protein
MDEHLGECPDCRERLATVQVAREALEAARAAWPVVVWQGPDAAVDALVLKRLASKARRPWLLKASLTVAALAAFALGTWALAEQEARQPPASQVASMAPPELEDAPTIRVDRAQGLMRVGARSEEVSDGAELASGDVLRTSLMGRAFVHLPDESYVRVAGGTQVALTRVEADDVALTLERGRVGVRASHAERRGFVVYSGGMTVHVVGTVFSVSNTGDALEVGVSEGQVRVEWPSGDALMVAAGQRVRFDARSEKPQRLKLTPGLERELSELTQMADAPAAPEKQVVGGSVGGTSLSAPPLVVAKGSPRTLPRRPASEPAQRHATASLLFPLRGEVEGEVQPAAVAAMASTQRLAPTTQVEVEGSGEAWSAMAGNGLRAVPEPRPASAPDEWAQHPEPRADEWMPMPPAAKAQVASAPSAEEWAPLPAAAPAPAPVVKKGVAPKDLETLFLQRAEAAIAQGDCEKYQLGLEDIAQDAERNARSEQARIVRARCYDVQLRPKQAVNEYRKYLSEYPKGR